MLDPETDDFPCCAPDQTPDDSVLDGRPTFLRFTEIVDTGKTKVWSVDNSNDGSHLGEVRWYGAWRRYALFVAPACIWSSDCLYDVSAFITDQMNQRLAVRRSRR